MSPIASGDKHHGPSSKTDPRPAILPPLSFDVDSIATGEMKTVCEIDPTDETRFLYGCALRGWSKYESYAFADLPSLLNAPGPPFYAVGKDREDTQESKVCSIDSHNKRFFVYECWEGGFASYPIVDIPSLITSTGAPFHIPLKNKSPPKPIPGFEASAFCREGHHSLGMRCRHRESITTASHCDETDEYGDYLANLSRASIRSLERSLGLPPAAFAYSNPHSADKPEVFEGFPICPASRDTSGSKPVLEVQEASFSGSDSLAIRRKHQDHITSASPPDEIDKFVGRSRPFGLCRNYGDCMLQASARTLERSLGLPPPTVLDHDQFADKTDSSEGSPTVPASSSTNHECFHSNCPQTPIPTVSSESDTHQNNPHWRSYSRHTNRYFNPSTGQIIIIDGPIEPYLRMHDGHSIDYNTGLHHTTNPSQHPSTKKTDPPSCPFCTDISNTGSWLLRNEEKKPLLDSHGCTYHRALLPRAEGHNLTPADDQALADFCKNPGDVRNDPVKMRALHDAVLSPMRDYGFQIRGRGSMNMGGDFGISAKGFDRKARERADLYERYVGDGLKGRYEMAGWGDDVEKGRDVGVERDGYDGKYRPRRGNRFMGKRVVGKKIRSMVFWIVVAILGLGLWLDRMHENDLAKSVGAEFGGGLREMDWGLKDGDEGVGVFPQLDPAAPDFGDWGVGDRVTEKGEEFDVGRGSKGVRGRTV